MARNRAGKRKAALAIALAAGLVVLAAAIAFETFKAVHNGLSDWILKGNWVEWPTMVAAAATALIIYVQAELLRDQNEQGRLQEQARLLMDLESTWRSKHFLTLRSTWAKKQRQAEEDLEGLELVVEFLEEFAVLRNLNLLDDDLIWDSTIGWHAVRYYFYSLSDIEKLRARWGGDTTLFDKLKNLWTGYLQVEQRERNLSPGQIEEELRETKDHFLKAEEMLSWLNHGE
jgi:hypothetical protein